MIGEIDVQGVLVAPLLVWMLIALVLNALLRRALAWTGFYRLVWHRALFDASLYVVLLGGVVALTSFWTAR
jgi:Protein of unknown function (DUF1656)